MENIKDFKSFNESDVQGTASRYLSHDEIEEIMSDDNLNQAMYDVQSMLGIDDGGVCGMYWSETYDTENGVWSDQNEVWSSASREERLKHLNAYLDLEGTYGNI